LMLTADAPSRARAWKAVTPVDRAGTGGPDQEFTRPMRRRWWCWWRARLTPSTGPAERAGNYPHEPQQPGGRHRHRRRFCFGDYNPAGRLVETWPKSIDQLPPMMDYNIRHGRTYMSPKRRRSIRSDSLELHEISIREFCARSSPALIAAAKSRSAWTSPTQARAMATKWWSSTCGIWARSGTVRRAN